MFNRKLTAQIGLAGLPRSLRPRWAAVARAWLGFALGALAWLTAGVAAAAGPSVLNVATYNLRLNTPSDGPNVWAERREAVKALVRYHEFDLFGTQEGQPEQIRDLEALDEYAHVGVGRDDGKDAGEHSAIFYRRARFELLQHGDFWLSETPDRPSKGWDGRCCNRLVSWVRLRDRVSGLNLLVTSAHFDHEGVVAQRESAKLLLRWLAANRVKGAKADRVIALGDFNSTPESEPIALMRAVFGDARQLSEQPPYGPAASFNDFRFGTAPDKLIDFIFVDRGIRVLKYAVLSDSNGVRYPSDHFPVLARLQLR